MMMDTDPEIQKRIADLAEDHERGATDLAREALDILQFAADKFPQDGLGAFLDGVGILIVLARPNMASVKGAVSRALADGPLSHPGQAKRAIERARSWIDFAAKAAVEEAGSVIPDGATVLTCSFSSTVLDACASAMRQGKSLRVLTVESRIGTTSYGELMADGLAGRGVPADVLSDDAIASSLDGVTLALVGADRVLPDGSMVNGTPTLSVAEQLSGIAPLYVVCGTFKLDDQAHASEGYDTVPASLVTAYITERGVASPEGVWTLKGT